MDFRIGKTKTSKSLKNIQWLKLFSLLDSVQVLRHCLHKTVENVGTNNKHGLYIK